MKKGIWTKCFLVGLTIMPTMNCEQVVELGTIPYEEKLVVRAVLEAGQPVERIYFTRTLSLEEAYSPDKAVVTDIQAVIISDGTAYPLSFIGQVVRNGMKTGFAEYSAAGLVAQPTRRYELVAYWNGHSLRAQTRVPDTVNIDTTYLQLQSDRFLGEAYYLVTQFKSEINAVYVGDYEFIGAYPYSFGPSSKVVKPGLDGEKISINVLVGLTYQANWKDSLFTKVISFDQPYYDYYRTRRNSRPGSPDDIFVGPGEPVFWNVEGEALGMFIGMTMTKKKVYVP